MPAKKKTLAQTSLEYLVTYGWAMVLIATIIGVLVFTAGGAINTNSCTTFLQMICKGINAEGDTLILVLQNATGQKITINPYIDIMFDEVNGYAIVTYKGQEYRFEDVTISPGDEFKIEGQGMVLADQLSITFYEHQTGITRTITSTLSTSAPPTIELSNDGIDNDGDGLIDCEDDPTECEYFGAPTGASGTDPCSDNCTITFGPLETSRTEQLTGIWSMPSTTLVVYVSTHQAGTTAHISYFAQNSVPQTVNQGWNEFPIDLIGVPYTGTTDVDNFSLILDSGGFTVLRDASHTPKVLVYLDEFP